MYEFMTPFDQTLFLSCLLLRQNKILFELFSAGTLRWDLRYSTAGKEI